MKKLVANAITTMLVQTSLLVCNSAHSATYDVTNNNWDANPGSLRWAIEQSNINPGPDNIRFIGNRNIVPTDHMPITSEINVNNTNNGNVTISNAAFNGFAIEAGGNNSIIQDITIVNTVGFNALYIIDVTDIIIDNVDMSGSTAFGLSSVNTARVTVRNSSSFNNTMNGINFANGDAHQILNTAVYGNTGAGIVFTNVSNTLVENCNVGVLANGTTFNAGTKNHGHGVFFTTAGGSSSNNIVRNNVIANNGNSEFQHDLYFEGNNTNTTLLTNNQAYNNNIGYTATGVRAPAFGNGISFSYSQGGAIYDNLVSGGQANATAGISIYGAVNLDVYDNNVDQAHSLGIYFGGGASGGTIRDNQIVNTTAGGLGVGLFIEDVINADIRNNTITGNASNGIQINSSTNVGSTQIRNNTIDNNTLSGIEMNDADDLPITNNSIQNNGSYGVLINQGADNTISGNNISGNGNDGVGLTAPAAIRDDLRNNIISCNSGEGIDLSGVGNTNYATPVIDPLQTTADQVVGTVTPNSTIQIFDNSCDCEAQTLLATQFVAGGNFNVNIPAVLDSSRITVFATDGTGNTSQLTECCRVAVDAFNPPLSNFCAGSGGSITLTMSQHVGGSFQLQQSPNGSSGWSNTQGAHTAAGITWTVSPTTTTFYRVVATSNGWGAPGAYTCQDISPVVQVRVDNPPTDMTANIVDATCGASDGEIHITNVSGGTPAFQYELVASPGLQALGDFTGLAAGNHDVRVVDANGCDYTESFTISTGAWPTDLIATDVDANCGNADGEIHVTNVIGGGLPYQYELLENPGLQATGDFLGLLAGNYTIRVVDAGGCDYTEGITVADVPGPTSLVANTISTTCSGSNGEIHVTSVGGGSNSYQYELLESPGLQATGDFTGLTAGNYNIRVVDANGCDYTQPIVVGDTPGPTSVNISTNNSTCGSSNGEIHVTSVTGGTANYSYEILENPGLQGTGDFTGLIAGNYNVRVVDANLCEITMSTGFVDESGPTITSVTPIDATCGNSDGSLTIVASGGTGTIDYSIDNGTTFQPSITFSSLGSGSYNVVIEDDNGCQDASIAAIADLGGPQIDSYNNNDPLCSLPNGDITINASGGTVPLQYSIDGGTTFQLSGSFSGLTDGGYSVIVEDANNCITSGSTTLNDNPPPVIVSITGGDPTCSLNNGTIAISATGSGPLQHSIDGGSTYQGSGNYNNLAPATYNIEVQDVNNCTASGSVSINDQPGPMITNITGTDLLCHNDNTGTVSVTVTGGTSPVGIEWDDPSSSTTTSVAGLAAGIYTVTITDVNSCSASQSFTIGEPTPLTATTDPTNATCNLSTDGSINLTASGGIPPYLYDWSNDATTQDINNLGAGTYSVVITDSNGCQTNTSDVIIEPGPLVSDVQIAFDQDEVCKGDLVTASVINTTGGGTSPTFAWYVNGVNTGQSGTVYSSVLQDNDEVAVLMISSELCAIGSVTDQVYISVKKCSCPVTIPNAISPNGDGNNDGWIISGFECWDYHLVRVFNRYGSVVYKSDDYLTPWNGQRNGQNMPVGTYYYVVTVNQEDGESNNYTGTLTIMR